MCEFYFEVHNNFIDLRRKKTKNKTNLSNATHQLQRWDILNPSSINYRPYCDCWIKEEPITEKQWSQDFNENWWKLTNIELGPNKKQSNRGGEQEGLYTEKGMEMTKEPGVLITGKWMQPGNGAGGDKRGNDRQLRWDEKKPDRNKESVRGKKNWTVAEIQTNLME